METNTALATLQGLPVSKAEGATFAQKLKSEILSGNFSVLQARIFLKSVIDTLSSVTDDKDIKDSVMEESRKFGEKTFEFGGAKVTMASKTTYDFSNCKDPVYDDLTRQMETLKAQIKAREALLKTGSDNATGEVFNPPSTSTAEYITISIL